MTKQELISQIYKILLLYEDVLDINSTVKPQDYLAYLDRLYVYWLGVGRDDVFNIIRGLRMLELNAEHQTVKQMVFHVIDVVQKMEVGDEG